MRATTKTFLVVSILLSHPLSAEDIPTHIVKVEENGVDDQKRSDKNNRATKEFFVIVKPSAGKNATPIINLPSDTENYKRKNNKIDCGKSASFGDLIACEGLLTQQSIDNSTVGIRNWTVVGSIFAILAFFTGVCSIWLLSRTNKIARQQNILTQVSEFKFTVFTQINRYLA